MAEKIGIMDVGGGMRCVFGAGVLDRFLADDVHFDYCLGISAGSGNLASYLAGQFGRNLRFYRDYAQRSEYMSLKNFLLKKNFLDLSYIYGTITNSGGEDPVDYEALKADPSEFLIAATNVRTAKVHFFTKEDIVKDDYSVLMASCAIPILERPVTICGNKYCDGGILSPIPYMKAFADGVTKLYIILTLPLDMPLDVSKQKPFLRLLHPRYPELEAALMRRGDQYNKQLSIIRERYVPSGKIVLIAPESLMGMSTFTVEPDRMQALYDMGYHIAGEIEKDM